MHCSAGKYCSSWNTFLPLLMALQNKLCSSDNAFVDINILYTYFNIVIISTVITEQLCYITHTCINANNSLI